MNDITQQSFRALVLKDIKSEENKKRKRISIKNLEVYRKKQEPYVLEKLKEEFDDATIKQMRKIFSINLVERIVNEKASLYNDEPKRVFSIPSGEVTEAQKKQIENLYRITKVNSNLKKSNKISELQKQGSIYCVKSEDKLILRVLHPHHYDVIPNPKDPEKADVYIISIADDLMSEPSVASGTYSTPIQKDGINQVIGDGDDAKALKERYLWWSAQYNFVTDGKGNLIDGMGINPIGVLPFIDFNNEKDFAYWCNMPSDIVEFSLDFSLLLSDTATINRLQGYSQMVLYSEKPPTSIKVGPNQVMHLPISKHVENDKTRFEFVTPSPDMGSALELLSMVINLFLTSTGEDGSVISSKGEAKKYSSGVDRLLDMLNKFEKTKDEMDKFKDIESELLKVLIKWSNIYVNTPEFNQSLKIAKLPDDLEVNVQYTEPQMIQSQSELEDSLIKRLKNKLITRKEAIKKLYDLDDKAAEDYINKINEESEGKDTTNNNPDDNDPNEVIPKPDEEQDGEDGEAA